MVKAPARSNRLPLLLLVAAVISVVCFGQKSRKPGQATHSGPDQEKLRDPAFIKDGAAIFVPSCSSSYCHGSQGLGGSAPRLRGRDFEASYIFRTVSNGIPGTPMIGFKSDLTEEQRWKVVAFILSPVGSKAPAGGFASAAGSSPPAADGTGESRAPVSAPSADSANGRDLFYDLANQRSCHGCHAINGIGGKVGPDLGALASARSSSDLMSAILKPPGLTDSKYMTITVTMTDGDKIVGVKKEDGRDFLRIYDTTVLPVVLRTVSKSEIVKSETSEKSVMPGNYSSIYSEKQLADIVAFIKSAGSRTDR